MTTKIGKDSNTAATKDKTQPTSAKPKAKVEGADTKSAALAKQGTKSPAKVVAKPLPKGTVAAKTQAKAVVKTAPKSAAKTPVATKSAPAVAKPAPKPSTSKVTTATKPSVKSQAKPTTPSASKPRPLASSNPMPVSPATSKSKTTVSAAPAVAKVVATPTPVPAKAGRPSSRLAQLTVPSIAQSVASTAAKASYTQSEPTHLIVPALPSSIKKDPKLANNWKTTPAAQLSDAELLAMPDAEYMSALQLAVFRLKLMTLKTDILNSAGETTEHLREDSSVVPDPADRATIEEEHALELRTRDRERKLLKKIEQSIGRIDAGDYGYCDETGEPIGVGRLLARPTATLSLEAQQRRELKQKMFGD